MFVRSRMSRVMVAKVITSKEDFHSESGRRRLVEVRD